MLVSIPEKLCDHLWVSMISLHMVRTSTLSSALTATWTGVGYSMPSHMSSTEGVSLTPLTPSSVSHCSLNSVDFHVAILLQTLTLCTSLMADVMDHGEAILHIKWTASTASPPISRMLLQLEMQPLKVFRPWKATEHDWHTCIQHALLWRASRNVWCNFGDTWWLKWWPRVWLCLT